MKNLYLLNYNNYYNRKFKKENNLTNYLNNPYQVFSDVNFNPHDGITTTQVVNFAIGSTEFNADYLIVADDEDNIISRWFVIENMWNRKHQLILTLRRDLLVDYYNDYKNSPFFCEKGLVSYTDNFIFNSENMTYNQIKTTEIPLNDETNSRWVILYVARNFKVEDEQATYRLSTSANIKFHNTRASFDFGGTYEVWCFPYDDVNFQVPGIGVIQARGASSTTQGAIANLPLHIGDAFLYDYQLVPYCPFIGTRGFSVKEDNNKIKTIVCPNNDYDYEVAIDAKGQPIPLNGLVMVYSSTAECQLNFSPIYPYQLKTAIDYKVDSECRFIRVSDTLGQSVFEMNVAKNNGNFEFDVFVKYKPYSPSIRIKPYTTGLYGLNKNDDQRGVSTVGSYSLPQISSAWREYQIQNTNYMNIFNRGIQNQEVNRDVQLKQMQITGTLNAISTGLSAGGTAGYLSGQSLGPGPGSLIGIGTGVTAGALSLAGAAEDIKAFKTLSNEAIDYSKDLFGYQMGNIQALPTNLVSPGVFGAMSKKFPFIEIYSASDEEIAALKNKVKYNGFSIGRIGTFADFESNAKNIKVDVKYIKGNLIRCDEIKEDYHVLAEITNELNKGVFV